ncbi:NADH-quinone oxidoreductase subunit NuoK [Stetteria hydrogenophila]
MDRALGETAIVTSLALIAIGLYGVASTRNLLRMLLSLEVVFNGILLGIVAFTSFNPVVDTLVAVLLVSVVTVEVVVAVAILIGFYRHARTLESEGLEEGGV